MRVVKLFEDDGGLACLNCVCFFISDLSECFYCSIRISSVQVLVSINAMCS